MCYNKYIKHYFCYLVNKYCLLSSVIYNFGQKFNVFLANKYILTITSNIYFQVCISRPLYTGPGPGDYNITPLYTGPGP